jgi:hypothetical protein
MAWHGIAEDEWHRMALSHGIDENHCVVLVVLAGGDGDAVDVWSAGRCSASDGADGCQ